MSVKYCYLVKLYEIQILFELAMLLIPFDILPVKDIDPAPEPDHPVTDPVVFLPVPGIGNRDLCPCAVDYELNNLD